MRDVEREYLSRAKVPEKLPEDVATLQQLIVDLAADNARMLESIEYLQRKLFGRSSERVSADEYVMYLPGLGFDDAVPTEGLDGAAEEVEPEDETEVVRRRKGHGRRKLPADLPRERVVHDLPEEEKVCEHGVAKVCIGEEVSEKLEYVPAVLKIIEHVRPKYASSGCEQCVLAEQGEVQIAPLPPQVIPKGLAEPGLLAHVVVAKCAYHMPLYRLERQFEHLGYEIPRTTMCDWMLRVGQALAPLVGLFREKILESLVIKGDETPVGVQQKERLHQAFMWQYQGDAAHPYTVFDFRWTRSREGPRAYFGITETTTRYKGFFQADAYEGYNPLYEMGATQVGCWAHARRYFHEAKNSDPIRSREILLLIKHLYKVEALAREQRLSAEDRLALRQDQSAEFVEKFWDRVEELRGQVLPKSLLGKACTYAVENKVALMHFMKHGFLDIDNNASENALRPIAVGRKNWLFVGSERGGKAAATIYSVLESARRHNLNPMAYVTDILRRFPTIGDLLNEFLPDVWGKAHPEHVLKT